ncbi:unnamed protein product [Moneuplotes crassus]|uniref:Uncharacterized protein n=1 Tax=Euplotes crassus TaxID=5936 RepID=A0AAD1X7V9_EUPCR|nr:unnamed protein product [Moneuplotes crassus]
MSEYYYDELIRPSMASRSSGIQVEEIIEDIPSSRETSDFIADSINENVSARGVNRQFRYFRMGEDRQNQYRLQQKPRSSSPEEPSEDLVDTHPEEIEDDVDTPDAGLSSNQEWSFCKNHEYTEAPQIIRHSSSSVEEKVEFMAGTPERRRYYERKTRLGLADSSLVKELITSADEPHSSTKKKPVKRQKRKKSKKSKLFVKKENHSCENKNRARSGGKPDYYPYPGKFKTNIDTGKKSFPSPKSGRKSRKSKTAKLRKTRASKTPKQGKTCKKIRKKSIKRRNQEITLKQKYNTRGDVSIKASPEKNKQLSKSQEKDDMGRLGCSVSGASKGKLLLETDLSRYVPENTPKVKKRYKRKCKKLIKTTTTTPRIENEMIVTPHKSMIIYDYNEYGSEIVKKETIHEYIERPYSVENYRPNRSTYRNVDRNWDISKCRESMELDKIVRDAWKNIDKNGHIKAMESTRATRVEHEN